MSKKQRTDVLTLLQIFYNLSVLCDALSKSKNRQNCDILLMAFNFSIVRVRVMWQIFQLQFIIEKLRPDVLTLSKTFYDLNVAQSLLKGRNASISPAGSEGLIIIKSGVHNLRLLALRAIVAGQHDFHQFPLSSHTKRHSNFREVFLPRSFSRGGRNHPKNQGSK